MILVLQNYHYKECLRLQQKNALEQLNSSRLRLELKQIKTVNELQCRNIVLESQHLADVDEIRQCRELITQTQKIIKDL